LQPNEESCLPGDKQELQRLARALGYASASDLNRDYKKIQKQNETLFAELFPKF
jgi:glutamine synthetase adenylyltransferase